MRRRERGAVLVETILIAPVAVMLLTGTIEFGRLIYIYVAIEKILYTVARGAASTQGINFCADADTTLGAIKQLAVTGSEDSGGTSIVGGLTVDQIAVRAERINATDGTLGLCDCSVSGCDTASGGLPPDFVTAYLTDGYSFRPLFFGLTVTPVQLRPHVRVPFGGP